MPPFTAAVQDGERWLGFARPVASLRAERPSEIADLLRTLERRVESERLWAVGFLSYEAAAAFALPVRPPSAALPLARFDLFAAPETAGDPGSSDEAACVEEFEPALGFAEYADRLDSIREHIAAGDTYQANFTFAVRVRLRGDPWEFFRSRLPLQRAAHAAYLDLGRHAICCFSPELFFAHGAGRIVARPMKGTAPRGATPEADAAAALRLQHSSKDRAENLMIVDMLRNDLGRVADVGSVEVPALFQIERYPTLLQMTSTVAARTRAGLARTIGALFPCASVTGAPKRRTMQILAEHEREPRGLYTGAIGFLAPGGRSAFNVAIRTLVVDRESGAGRYGVGSGVVADSRAEAEYAECLLKARILTQQPFRLLETLRWTPEAGFFLLQEHLERLAASAAYFGMPPPVTQDIREALERGVAGLRDATRVRLLLDAGGGQRVETAAIESEAEPVALGLAATPVDPDDPWLHHKTTRRERYASALRERPDCADVLLWNVRGELTESTRANLVVELDGALWTPPAHCGLLAGTFRRHLLEAGRIRERVIRPGELPGRRLFLINSVRGWQAALLRGDGRRPASG